MTADAKFDATDVGAVEPDVVDLAEVRTRRAAVKADPIKEKFHDLIVQLSVADVASLDHVATAAFIAGASALRLAVERGAMTLDEARATLDAAANTVLAEVSR